MKKILLASLFVLSSLSVQAEIVSLYGDKQEVFVDKKGLYRYMSGKNIYQKECNEIYQEEARRKCMEAEEASWRRSKTPEELQKEGTLFSGKIKTRNPQKQDVYFYVENGVRKKQIQLFLNRYYFEKNQDNQDVLYDIETELPYSGELVVGKAEIPLLMKKDPLSLIVRQKYEDGMPVGEPKIIEEGK